MAKLLNLLNLSLNQSEIHIEPQGSVRRGKDGNEVIYKAALVKTAANNKNVLLWRRKWDEVCEGAVFSVNGSGMIYPFKLCMYDLIQKSILNRKKSNEEILILKPQQTFCAAKGRIKGSYFWTYFSSHVPKAIKTQSINRNPINKEKLQLLFIMK